MPGLFLAAGVPFRLEKDLQHPYLAALDRQHPRDLFDVRDLLANEGITDDLREAFIIYLISHDRPISEVVVPRRKDIEHEFTHGFEGMSADEVSLDELLEARETLIVEHARGNSFRRHVQGALRRPAGLEIAASAQPARA
ncbi:nucleotidyl transferase AbiEii/AbiGii toxin family protein [Bradyrhizobium septentrionale]|uniref:Nucleotidyl transferase AbiEii/AbiGii toxin family protein n=1 Tax=Bradyrhizobium septentrionale TaxID=1404411 RepID=A0ABZ2PF89_9BRAD